MNRDLAMQQAYSRRAPGSAFAEEQNRRLQANQIAGAQRMFGGDANKIAAISAGATAQGQDANSRIQAQGQQFSENAYNKLSNANLSLAQNDRINQDQYVNTKNALDNAGNTNIYNGLSSAGSSFMLGKTHGSDFKKYNSDQLAANEADPQVDNSLKIGGFPQYNTNLSRTGNIRRLRGLKLKSF